MPLSLKSKINKKPNQYSVDEIVWFGQEMMKCKNDPVYFIETYALFRTPGKEDQTLPLHEGQLQLFKAILEYHNIINLKSRQIGMSTGLQMFCSWLITFFPGVQIGVISKKQSAASDFIRIIKNILYQLPEWMNVGFDQDSNQSIILKNGAAVYAENVSMANPDQCLRGKSITFLIIDEAAFISKIDIAYNAIMPALSTEQLKAKENGVPYGTVILSTPNGTLPSSKGFWYFSMWCNAIRTGKPFFPLKTWWKDINYFKRDNCIWYYNLVDFLLAQGNTPEFIDQELDLKFIVSSGSKIVPQEKLNHLSEFIEEPKSTHEIILDNVSYELKMWKKPEEVKNKICIGVDTATSYGNDLSSIQAQDMTTGEHIFEFNSKLSTLHFKKIVEYVMKLYPNNITAIENDGVGLEIAEYIETIPEIKDSLYYTQYKNKEGVVSRVKVGISQNGLRNQILESMFDSVKYEEPKIKSNTVYLQLCSMKPNKSGKIEGFPHDDAAMAYAIACYLRRNNIAFQNNCINNKWQDETTHVTDYEYDKMLDMLNDEIAINPLERLENDRLKNATIMINPMGTDMQTLLDTNKWFNDLINDEDNLFDNE